MQTIHELFGQGSYMNIPQMTLRAVAIFFTALVLVRYTRMRAFSNVSAFDTSIIISPGAVLNRAVVELLPLCQLLSLRGARNCT